MPSISRRQSFTIRRAAATAPRRTCSSNTCAGTQSGLTGQMIWDTDNLLCWMIRDCQSRDLYIASQRLAIVGRYLSAIHLAGLTATDLMADFRAAHRQPSWPSLVKALQSPDSAAELKSLQAPPPIGPLHPHVQRYRLNSAWNHWGKDTAASGLLYSIWIAICVLGASRLAPGRRRRDDSTMGRHVYLHATCSDVQDAVCPPLL